MPSSRIPSQRTTCSRCRHPSIFPAFRASGSSSERVLARPAIVSCTTAFAIRPVKYTLPRNALQAPLAYMVAPAIDGAAEVSYALTSRLTSNHEGWTAFAERIFAVVSTARTVPHRRPPLALNRLALRGLHLRIVLQADPKFGRWGGGGCPYLEPILSPSARSAVVPASVDGAVVD